MNSFPEEREWTTSVLLVTSHQNWRVPDWVDVAHTAQASLVLWRERRHPFVFADIGALGDNFTGPRLVRTLHRLDPLLTIYLTSTAVQPTHVVWAKACGASGVIERSLRAITEAVPPHLLPYDTQPPANRDAERIALEAMQIAEHLTRQLLAHGRIGPVASVLVEDAIRETLRRHPDERLSIANVCTVLLPQLPSLAGRKDFLSSLRGK